MIEGAWGGVGGETESRDGLAEGRRPPGAASSLRRSLDTVIPALEQQLARLSADDLLGFDRILERKLYDIDRADIHDRTGGSDDGFLYCRGFIVALGRAYYEAVRGNPRLAGPFAACGKMSYLPWHLYRERFGKVPPSGISRETTANTAGWPSDAAPGTSSGSDAAVT